MKTVYKSLCLYFIFVTGNLCTFGQKHLPVNSSITVPLRAIDGKADHSITPLLTLDTSQLLNDKGFACKFQLKNTGIEVDTLRYPLDLITIAMVSEKGSQVVFPSTPRFYLTPEPKTFSTHSFIIERIEKNAQQISISSIDNGLALVPGDSCTFFIRIKNVLPDDHKTQYRYEDAVPLRKGVYQFMFTYSIHTSRKKTGFIVGPIQVKYL